MTTIQLPNQIIGTNLKPKAALELFKNYLYDFIDQHEDEAEINIDLFVEQLLEQEDPDSEPDFYLVDEDSIDLADIVISEEDLDSIIEDYLEYGSEDQDGEDEDEEDYIDEAEDEPEFFDDEEDEE
jgi:hypothetical protein